MRRFAIVLGMSAWCGLVAAPGDAVSVEPTAGSPQAATAQRDVDVDEYVVWLQQQMRKMDAVLERVRRSESPTERRDLMRGYAVALEVTNALTRAIDPYVGAPAAAKEMSCPMMGAKGKPAKAEPGEAAAPDVTTTPEDHEAHH